MLTSASRILEVLKGIDLEIGRGQVTVILRPSGSGESTFLSCVNKLETTDGRSVHVDGELTGLAVNARGRLRYMSPREAAGRRRDIGTVFQITTRSRS